MHLFQSFYIYQTLLRQTHVSVFTMKVECTFFSLLVNVSGFIFRYFTPNHREVLDTICLWLQVVRSENDLFLLHPGGRIFNSDWFINRFIMVV